MRQELLRTPTAALLVGARHPFYVRLGEKKFEEGVEAICEDFYAGEVGRPGLSPGIFFGCQWWATSKDSERRNRLAGQRWSVDSIVRVDWGGRKRARTFEGSRTRRLLDVERHQAVVPMGAAGVGGQETPEGTTIDVDATTLEAAAALRSIRRRDTGERYEEFLMLLPKESGIETPTGAVG